MAFKPWQFQDGNNAYEKYKTPEERLAVYEKYCKHLSEGNSVDSFPECAENTIRRLIEKYPVELSPDLLRKAIREGKRFWEAVGKNGTIGIPTTVNGKQYDKFNAKSWQFIMMNKYGEAWREEKTSDISLKEAVSYEDTLKKMSPEKLQEYQQLMEEANILIATSSGSDIDSNE
jgi:hypothetical protein